MTLTSENPYEPPSAPLFETEPVAFWKRLRWRYIPAAICFFYGGLGMLMAIGAAIVIASLGISRIRLGALAINLGLSGLALSALLIAGWAWLRGKWVMAMVFPVAAIAMLAFFGWALRGTTREIVIPPQAGVRQDRTIW